MSPSPDLLSTPTDQDAPQESRDRPGWKDWWAKTGLVSLELENTGSVARDHLASERTFLAWLRTSLAFCSMGVALTQLFSHSAPLTADPVPAPTITSSSSIEAQFEAVEKVYQDILQTLQQTQDNRRFAKPLGGVLVGTGFIVLLIGLVRYFTIQNQLILNKFPATRISVMGVSALSGAMVVVVFAILMAF